MAKIGSLTDQTLYAELVDRCEAADFEAEFPLNGSFVSANVKDRKYWYFQAGARNEAGTQPRKYVGPDSAAVLERIANHGRAKDDYKERRHLISMLRHSGFRGPPGETGRILQVLQQAGLFRMRACLVGTTAYQVYAPMLGARLPAASLMTQDLDIAQSTAISIEIGKNEHTSPLLEILQRADSSFRPVPHNQRSQPPVAYQNKGGFRIDVLADNRGPDTDAPTALPAIGAHAHRFRFMDFLIYSEMRAAVLFDGGVLVNVPAPERYALHKLIVAEHRASISAKKDKDIEQAEALLAVLVARRSTELREAWHEAWDRGRAWRDSLANGLGRISSNVRDQSLHIFGATRNLVPGLDLRFTDSPGRYDFDRDTVVFAGESRGERVLCAISREALEDHFGADGQTKEQRIETFRKNRGEIERMAREVYLNRPVPFDGSVLIRTAEISDLRKTIRSKRRASVKPQRRTV
jgi:hypothetical protein